MSWLSTLLHPVRFWRAQSPRSIDTSTLDHRASGWLVSWALGRATTSGVAVSPASAMALSTYYACLRNVSEDIAKLPLITYQRVGRGKRRAPEHPYYELLRAQPNEDMSSMSMREVLMHHAMAWGNAYAEIVWTPGQRRVHALYPLHPSRVWIRRDDAGALVYDVVGDDITLPSGESFGVQRIRQSSMLHVKGLGAEGYSGYSVLALAAESLGLGLAAQAFGAAFFGNGASIGAILSHPSTLSPEAQKRLRESFQTVYGGGPSNAMKVAVLEEGLKYEKLGIPPNEAQFLETRQFQVLEIARWFRVPPDKLGDLSNATFSNIEHQAIAYVVDTLTPWAVRFEQEFNRKLFAGTDFFCEHVFQAQLRGDQQARANFYKELFGMAALSPNDIRELENMNPIAHGSTYFVAANNYRPLQEVVEGEGLAARNGQRDTTPRVPALPARNGTSADDQDADADDSADA
jgi:HK97 family phage portal protein